jgi:hypothetical protein
MVGPELKGSVRNGCAWAQEESSRERELQTESDRQGPSWNQRRGVLDPLEKISATNVLVEVTTLGGSPQQVAIDPLRDEEVLVDRAMAELQFQYGRVGIITGRPQCCRVHQGALHKHLLMDSDEERRHRGYGERAVSNSEYCSRSIRLSFSRNLPRAGSAMSSRILPNSASVSKQNRWR